MSYEKQSKLAKRLYEKTVEGGVDWKSTITSDVFQVSFKNFTVQIVPDEPEPADYSIRIINDSGEVTDSFSDEEMDKLAPFEAPLSSWYLALKDMHERARRYVLGADRALDEILNEID